MEFLRVLEGLRTPFLDDFMSLATNLGGEVVFMAAALVIFWCVNKQEGYYLLTVGFAGTILNQFLKLTFRIPRPWVRDPDFTIVESARADATGYSFPSGHTQNALTVFGCMGRWSKGTLGRALCAGAVLLVGFSRMYLGVHTPQDVGVAAVLGLVLVFGLYPLFRAPEAHPKRMYWIFGSLIGLNILYLLYVNLWTFPTDMDTQNLTEGIQNGWKLLGAAVGMLLAYAWDDQRLHFDPKASWLAQLIKVALGLAVLLALKETLKAPLLTLSGGHPAAHALRYLIMVVFAAGVWPMTFPWLSRLGRREQELTKRRDDHEQG